VFAGTEVEWTVCEEQRFDIGQLGTAGGAETKDERAARERIVFGGYLWSLFLALCWHDVLDWISADVRPSGELSFRCYLVARESEHNACQAGCELSRAEGR
jgi:hypothetical protein